LVGWYTSIIPYSEEALHESVNRAERFLTTRNPAKSN